MNQFQERVGLMVVGTLCAALLGVLVLAGLGKIDPDPVVNLILVAASSLASAVITNFVRAQMDKKDAQLMMARYETELVKAGLVK